MSDAANVKLKMGYTERSGENFSDIHLMDVVNETKHPVASRMLLGQNLEMGLGNVDALLSDVLTNAKFLGPADPQTGIAPGWQPYGGNMAGFRCELTSGMSLSGHESQMIHSFTTGSSPGILQTGRALRAGQTYELEVWARVRHQPVSLRFDLTPLASRAPAYASASVVIDAAYWKCYKLQMTAPCEDDAAVFMCFLMGEGMVWIDQVHLRPLGGSHLHQPMLDQIQSMNVPTLRFPGGCISTNYHWQHGTGPVHRRPMCPDPVFKAATSYEFGVDEYLTLCDEGGIQPHLVVNIGSGTPQDAVALAEYVAQFYRDRGQEPPEAYFQVGNEHYGAWELAHMTGAMYIEALRAYVPAIRAAYPHARIVVLGEGESHGLRPGMNTTWCDAVLDQAGDLFDVIALNRYKGQWHEGDEQRVINVLQSVRKIEEDLIALRDAVRQRGLSARLGLTEWNYWLQASHWDGQQFYEPFDIRHVLFAAGMIHAMARLAPDMELANYYHLVRGMGIFGRRGDRVERSCIADIFTAYGQAMPGEVLPISVVSPEIGTEPTVDALCLRSAAGLWLFVAHAHPTEPVTIQLTNLPGFAKVVDCWQAAGLAQSPVSGRVDPAKPGEGITLPPLSWTCLQLA